MKEKTKVFINYRQIDCTALANSLANTFKQRLGPDTFFLDKESIAYGKSISEEIQRHLESARVLLVLIGPGWHQVTDQDNDKRLLKSEDWVRREIEMAHDQDKLIIPVLSNQVDFSKVSDWLSKGLAPSLAFLTDLKTFPIRENAFEEDMEELLDYLADKASLQLQPAKPAKTGPSPEEYLQQELDRHFPLLKKYQVPVAEAPFKGLDFFKKEDAPLFFGRTGEILKLCRAAENFNLVLLYGQSGAGKSSLLHAGILPRLEDDAFITRYFRREKERGYHRQLCDIVQQYSPDQSQATLVILDQVEEIFTDKREDWRTESADFWEELTQALTHCSAWTFILGFRSEYYPRIRDFLKERQILLTEDQELHLKPLNAAGIRGAITGVAIDEHLRNQFKLKIEKEMTGQLVADLLHDGKQDAHIGPLLQFQLRKLWDDAVEKRQSEVEWIHFTHDQYLSLRKETLGDLLDDQLALLQPRWQKFLDNGLALDILYGYTTRLLTATSQLDQAVLNRYDHIEDFSAFFDQLKNHLYLLICGGTKENPSTRLAHDALAPLIRERFQDSNAPAQRAWRIVETKQRDIGISFLTSFSETDIETILAGEQGMRKIPEVVRERMKDDQERYRRQKQDRFQLAFDTASTNVEHLSYESALGKLQIAAQEGINSDLLLDKAMELPRFFLETEQLDHFKDSLHFIRQLGEEEEPEISRLLNLADQDKIDKTALKQQLQAWNAGLFDKMELRHFPQMCKIPGGTYQMGSEEGYADEKPVHEVSVSNFQMAATPVTCWQYGLFCRITGRELPGDSGFGRGAKPIINLNWYEAVEYCNWLTEWLSPMDGVKLEKVYTINGNDVSADWSKNGFRLLAEAEWEFAARAILSTSGKAQGGGLVRFGNGKDIADPAEMNFDAGHPYNEQKPDWYVKGKGLGTTTKVRKFAPNALGLYDMSGNVYEWCWDWYESSSYSEDFLSRLKRLLTGNNPLLKSDPVGPPKSSEGRRVVRGGSWVDSAGICRSSYRLRNLPIGRINDIGFRVVRRL